MKCMLAAALAAAFFASVATAQSGEPGKKILIAFFSKTSNTKNFAEMIQSRTGGELFHVQTKSPYPADYRETTRIAREEADSNARPQISTTLSPEEIKRYDVIFVGYPNWWSTMPMAMFTFLEQFDLDGKTIIPFCTHEGSGLGRGPDDLKKTCAGSNVLEGLAVRGSALQDAKGEVDAWLRKLGFTF